MTPPPDHPTHRLILAQLFERGAVAARGSGTYTNAAGTIVPAILRVVSCGPSPWFLCAMSADGTGQMLAEERVFSLDGAVDWLMARGDLPLVWTAEV